MGTLILLILILGILIFVHEFGHFITAKKCGAHVYEFALGMGPKIWGFKRKGDPTEYTIRAFPIGGFCAIAGEVSEEDDNKEKLKKSDYMCNKKAYQRLLILAAGVVMNFLTGFFLLFITALIWGASPTESIVGYMPEECTILDKDGKAVTEECPIYKSGIEIGDKIVKINGTRVNTWDKATLLLNLKHDKNTYTFTIKDKNGNVKDYEIEPLRYKDADGLDRITFGIGAKQEKEHGLGVSIKYAFQKTGAIINSMGLIIANLFTGKLSLSALSGPIGLYGAVGQAAKTSLETVIYLMAYLSLNLGFINFLPFPAVDGGRILFLIIETIRGKKMNPKVENTVNAIGFALLMLLMLIITVKDFINLF